MSVASIIRDGVPIPMHPWPRYLLDDAAWSRLADGLAADPLPLEALWADTEQVHALFVASDQPLLASVAAGAGYASLSRARPAIAHAERSVHDLFGHRALGVDLPPWLDHGHWEQARPSSARPMASPGNTDAPEFTGPAGAGQVAIGPVRGRLAPPLHLRLFTRGATVVSAQTLQGYAHRGVMLLARGKTPRLAARFAARLDGTATVAHGVAFARAAEAACEVAAPKRAETLREALLIVERLGVRLHHLAALLDEAGATRLAGKCAAARARLAAAVGAACGHRLAMDVVVPGGVALPISSENLAALRQAGEGIEESLPALIARVARRLDDDLARAAAIACLHAMTADAATLRGLLHDVPPGEWSLALPPESGEGLATVQGPVGAIWHWMRLDRGQIAAWFATSPGAGALEAAIAGRPANALSLVEAALAHSVAGRDG